jgi:hypothetical protein
MATSKYEYMKGVFVFSNVTGTVLVYLFLRRLVEENILKDPGLVLPITAAAVAFMAISSYLSFRMSPNIQKTKEEVVDQKTIALTIAAFLVILVGAYIILNNPKILFPRL